MRRKKLLTKSADDHIDHKCATINFLYGVYSCIHDSLLQIKHVGHGLLQTLFDFVSYFACDLMLFSLHMIAKILRLPKSQAQII